jgi:hypothetical protein
VQKCETWNAVQASIQRTTVLRGGNRPHVLRGSRKRNQAPEGQRDGLETFFSTLFAHLNFLQLHASALNCYKLFTIRVLGLNGLGFTFWQRQASSAGGRTMLLFKLKKFRARGRLRIPILKVLARCSTKSAQRPPSIWYNGKWYLKIPVKTYVLNDQTSVLKIRVSRIFSTIYERHYNDGTACHCWYQDLVFYHYHCLQRFKRQVTACNRIEKLPLGVLLPGVRKPVAAAGEERQLSFGFPLGVLLRISAIDQGRAEIYFAHFASIFQALLW